MTAADHFIGRLTAGAARRGARLHRIGSFALLLGLASSAFATTPPNSTITNIATASYSIGANNFTTTATAAVNTAACSGIGIRIELLQYISAAGAGRAPAGSRAELVQPTGYSPGGQLGGPFSAVANPTLLGNPSPTPLPANLLLAPLSDAAGNPIAAYSRNEPIFIRVVNVDANINPAAADQLSVTLTTGNSRDSEVLQLTESGPSTGVFVGAIPSTFAAIGTTALPNDGKITISSHNEALNAVYNHINCTSGANIVSASSGLIDPYGIVFDSTTGAPVNGASITKIDVLTGRPATVYCNDAVTILPQPVTSGTPTVCDAVMSPGGYHFPLVPVGSYKLVITPPRGYSFPSAVPAANLPPGIGVPKVAPVILGNPGATPGGSYGGVFSVWGSSLRIDIPVDSGGTALSLQKSAGKAVVGIGEFVPYILSITNNSTTMPVTGALIADHPPSGFRYQKGSARLDGAVIPDPLIAPDASTLTFNVNLAQGATASLHYVLEVTPGARTGMAENTAVATGGFGSNTARASVLVREDLFRTKAILIGRVIDGSCDDDLDHEVKGLANARVSLQDGSYVLTDKDGRWHIDNLRAGTHVVQLDLDSLPGDYEVTRCEPNSRFAGRSYSQFVNLRGGTLWRADFHVQKKLVQLPRLTQTLSAKPAGTTATIALTLLGDTRVTRYSATAILPHAARYVPGSARLNGAKTADPDIVDNALVFRSQDRPDQWQDRYTFEVESLADSAELKSVTRFTTPAGEILNLPVAQIAVSGNDLNLAETFAQVPTAAAPASLPANEPAHLMEKLPYDDAWLATALPGTEWLHPQENFHPNLPALKVAVKHEIKQTVKLFINDQPVSPLLFDGTKTNAAHSVALSIWSAIPLKEGGNRIELVILDEQGKEVSRSVRNIHYAATPDRVELMPKQSRLVADGKTRPVIAVRFLDKDGVPVRRGLYGEFQLNEPYRSVDRSTGIALDPLTGQLGGKPRFEIKNDGLAMIELEPTTQSGEAILNFQFNDQRKQELRAWLEASKRDWILVGFAEGTVGHKILSGNLQALQAADAERQLFDGNKLAFYAKGSIRGDYLLTMAYDTAKQTGNNLLKQAVDPTQYYTLYADASQTRFDAASASRLYLKLERNQFYAMFGDYNTALSVTELSRYSRTLNGIKSEYKGENAGYNAFASMTSQAYIKDEIPGNGTSGIYKLSRGNLVINSDKIRVQSRDRFQSQIIVSEHSLTRYLDYDLDYALGTLTFHEPIATHDANLNPVYIVAEYESADPADKAPTVGGRGSLKLGKDAEIGSTLIHEGNLGARGDLQGIDGTYQLDGNTRLRAEAAVSRRDNAGIAARGSAWLGEVQHREEKWDSKAYVREQAAGFGLGQQANSEVGTRKMGIDGQVKVSETVKLQGQAYQLDNLISNANTSVVEGRINQKFSDNFNGYYGARSAKDKSLAGDKQSNQTIAGATYTMPDKKLSLNGAAEIGSGTAGSASMPDRAIFGANYKVSGQTKLFAEQEFARGEQIAANTTRAGVRTQPWTGGEASVSLGNSTNNDAERLYSNLGLVQRWQINDQWQTDFSIDRSQTLRNTGVAQNINTTPPFGSDTGDYTAATLGAAFHDTVWSGNGRVEIRNASISQQKNLQLGILRNLNEGRSMAAGFTMRNAIGSIFSTRSSDLRLSYAHRPNDSRWVWFNRTDAIMQSSLSSTSALKGSKLVNNLNANYQPNRRTQIALQYAAKYVRDSIDGTDYKGYTDLLGTEIRYDLNRDWDIGVFGSVMRSLNSGVRDYGIGGSVGYNLMENTWLSLGYNLRGRNDRDFTAAAYRARGPFATLRMKVDQDSLGLNKQQTVAPPMTGN